MKLIAFYLPQFHDTDYNNEWWGKGFTEWTNMKNAKSLFLNHYQPRIPLNNNYYDLTKNETLKWQSDLAKEYKVDAFCFYHYWFNKKLLLEKPIEMYLKNKDLETDFCLCWANETWTNAWAKGQSKERKVLIEQTYGDKEEWEEHFKYLLKFFKDKRYIKEDNKPILVIYKPQFIDNLNERLKYYNKRSIDEGFDGIIFMAQHVSASKSDKVKNSIIDYQIEYEPGFAFDDLDSKYKKFILRIKEVIRNMSMKVFKKYVSIKNKVTILDYDKVWKKTISRKIIKNHIPGAFVGWDNTPRYANRGKVIVNGNPDKFKYYFEKQYNRAKNEYKSKYLFIFAWNEWSEAGYLEPDEKYKYEYLNAIKETVEK